MIQMSERSRFNPGSVEHINGNPRRVTPRSTRPEKAREHPGNSRGNPARKTQRYSTMRKREAKQHLRLMFLMALSLCSFRDVGAEISYRTTDGQKIELQFKTKSGEDHTIGSVLVPFILTKEDVRILENTKAHQELEIEKHTIQWRQTEYHKDFVGTLTKEIDLNEQCTVENKAMSCGDFIRVLFDRHGLNDEIIKGRNFVAYFEQHNINLHGTRTVGKESISDWVGKATQNMHHDSTSINKMSLEANGKPRKIFMHILVYWPSENIKNPKSSGTVFGPVREPAWYEDSDKDYERCGPLFQVPSYPYSGFLHFDLGSEHARPPMVNIDPSNFVVKRKFFDILIMQNEEDLNNPAFQAREQTDILMPRDDKRWEEAFEQLEIYDVDNQTTIDHATLQKIQGFPVEAAAVAVEESEQRLAEDPTAPTPLDRLFASARALEIDQDSPLGQDSENFSYQKVNDYSKKIEELESNIAGMQKQLEDKKSGKAGRVES